MATITCDRVGYPRFQDLGDFSPKKEQNLGEQKFARLSVSNFAIVPFPAVLKIMPYLPWLSSPSMYVIRYLWFGASNLRDKSTNTFFKVMNICDCHLRCLKFESSHRFYKTVFIEATPIEQLLEFSNFLTSPLK